MLGLVKIDDKFYELEFYSNAELPSHMMKDTIVLTNKDKILSPKNVKIIKGYLFHLNMFIYFEDCQMLMYMNIEIRYKFKFYVLTTKELFDESDMSYIKSFQTINKFNL